jgi:acyl-CoA hydrolase
MSLDLHEALSARRITAEQAARRVRPGQHVFVGTASATPRTLLRALEALPNPPADVELIHFLTDGALALGDDGQVATRYRHRMFFVGAEGRAAVRQGVADYVPVPIARVPELMRNGRIRVDVALVQVTPPDAFGFVSLGVSVDVVAAAIESAGLVIAEVNPAMPWTLGDATVHLDAIDHVVDVPAELPEYRQPPVDDEVVHQIARYIAGTIDDGSTLQIGMGRIPQEALRYLDDRRDLGIHSDVITDAILPLLDKGILTGAQKSQLRHKIVCSLAFGTRRRATSCVGLHARRAARRSSAWPRPPTTAASRASGPSCSRARACRCRAATCIT